MGLVKEKMNLSNEAIVSYENAWKLSNQSSVSVGFHLASNYLKLKKYVECIKICKELLAKHPTYTDIDKEILSKAVMSLRV